MPKLLHDDGAGTSTYLIAWSFRVALEADDAFVAAYASGGHWARLFAGAAGYLGTELVRCDDGRYVTLDRWTSRDAYAAFRAANGDAYDALDDRTRALTLDEELVFSGERER